MHLGPEMYRPATAIYAETKADRTSISEHPGNGQKMATRHLLHLSEHGSRFASDASANHTRIGAETAQA